MIMHDAEELILFYDLPSACGLNTWYAIQINVIYRGHYIKLHRSNRIGKRRE